MSSVGPDFSPKMRGFRRIAAAALCGAVAAGALTIDSADAREHRRAKFRTAEKARKDPGPPIPPGPHHLVVSVKTQRVTLYSNGALAARAPVSTGTATHPTPTGVFSIIQKNRFHRSNIYSNAPMPFMQRLTWSGVALHEGKLPGYPASHGCIRLPADFAQYLWRTTKIGARVIVARDEIEPVAISHAKLFQPKPAVVSDAPPELRKAIEPPAGAVKTAEVTSTLSDASSTDRGAPLPASDGNGVPDAILDSLMATLEAKAKKPAPKGPVSVFVSRKEKKLFVRQGYEPLFSAPVAIRDEGSIVGTHVFTALKRNDGGAGLRWIALTMPPEPPAPERKARAERKPDPVIYRYDRRGRRITVPAPKPVEVLVPAPKAADVLDRLDLPEDLVDRIAEYVSAGSSLIVSDHGLGEETGLYTDFIVLTR